MIKARAAAMLLFLCAAVPALSEEATDNARIPGWYGGIELGMPSGFSTFSSFGHDKYRPGLNAGIFGGYRFNPIISAELRLKWGWASMSARDCCAQSDYWLGNDGAQYYAPVLDIPSIHFSDIYSRTSLQQYGAALNINLLGLFTSTRDSRWSIEATPQLYAAATRTNINETANGATFLETGTRWHLAYGLGLQAAYRITEQLRLAVYSAATGLSGSRIDAVPEKHHGANFLWENGIRLSIDLGSIFAGNGQSNRPGTTASDFAPGTSASNAAANPSNTATGTTAPGTIAPDTTAPVRTKPEPCAPDNISRTGSTSCAGTTAKTTPDTLRLLGSIYFATDEWTVPQDQYEALQAVLNLIKANPDAQIDIIGSCDHYGTDAMNMRISQLRADSVKAWLARRGIAKSRLNAEGRGVDRNEPDRTKARRVSIYIIETR